MAALDKVTDNMHKSDARQSEYEAKMRLPASGSQRPAMMSRALDRAHELRQFEIDSYWKRSQYFWLFQASAITLTGLIYSRAEGQALLLLAAGVGAVTAQVGWLTARGSKFWQSNWEAHIDRLEPEVEGRLTQVVLYQKGSVRSSLSRINERLFALLFTVWMTFFANCRSNDLRRCTGHN